MRLLAIDTATEACSAALWLDGVVIARHEVVGRTHTERLLPLLGELLAEAGIIAAQLDGLVAGIGPGSFAGVRIGVGLVKGMALAIDRPAVGITSLAMLAQAALDAGALRVLSCIDARMSEVYLGVYGRDNDGLAIALQPELVAPPAQVRLADSSGDWVAVGTGWGSYEAELRVRLACEISRVDGAALPRAEDGLARAVPLFERGEVPPADALQPIYLRNQVALTLLQQQQRRAEKG